MEPLTGTDPVLPTYEAGCSANELQGQDGAPFHIEVDMLRYKGRLGACTGLIKRCYCDTL